MKKIVQIKKFGEIKGVNTFLSTTDVEYVDLKCDPHYAGYYYLIFKIEVDGN